MDNTYTINGDRELGYYWHVARAGMPGVTSGTFSTVEATLKDLWDIFPESADHVRFFPGVT